jgi:hypothetical protein
MFIAQNALHGKNSKRMTRPNNPWRKAALLGIGIVSQILSPSGLSQQLSFQHNGAQYRYQWRDAAQQEKQLSFHVASYPNELSRFARLKPTQVNQYIIQVLKEEMSQLDLGEVQAQIEIIDDQPKIALRGRDAQKLSQVSTRLKQAQSKAYRDFLTQQHYVKDTLFSGEEVIRPDYKAIANQSAPYLKEILKAIESANKESTTRDKIEYLLNFVQNIPYRTLQSADESRGSGFMTPIQVLRNNMGDCDSKSTLMAGALQSYFPNIRIELIYLPDHALLALGIPAKTNDKTVKIDGMNFVALEPTGPAQLRLGQLGPHSQHYIDIGLYRGVTIHSGR